MKQSNKVREIVNCLCLNKQLWFKVQVKTAPPCDTTGFECFSSVLRFSSFSLENRKT